MSLTVLYSLIKHAVPANQSARRMELYCKARYLNICVIALRSNTCMVNTTYLTFFINENDKPSISTNKKLLTQTVRSSTNMIDSDDNCNLLRFLVFVACIMDLLGITFIPKIKWRSKFYPRRPDSTEDNAIFSQGNLVMTVSFSFLIPLGIYRQQPWQKWTRWQHDQSTHHRTLFTNSRQNLERTSKHACWVVWMQRRFVYHFVHILRDQRPENPRKRLGPAKPLLPKMYMTDFFTICSIKSP